MSENDIVTVVVGWLEPLIFGRGLEDVLREARSVHLLNSGLNDPELELVIVRQAPHVAIVGEAAARSRLRHLRALQPRTGLLVLADDPRHAYAMRVLASGASCVARNASPSDLLAAIRLTAQETRVFVSPDGQRVEHRYPGRALLRTLTKRETEVVELLCEALSNPEIAQALHISVETVRTHVRAILRKLGVQTRRELVGMPIHSRHG